jgi:valyl-tRNA synthetase
MTIDDKFRDPYDPQNTESRIYTEWLQSGLFDPDNCIAQGITDPDAPTFSIVLPPPNVTGTLHTGHAMMLAIEDIMVRFNRMRGLRTLWIPGTDHAAIATQSKVEKNLAKEKIRRHDLGREEFLKRVNEFAQASHDTIVNQLKKMGASVDWGREAFTLDESRELAVRTAFKQMYEAGLIYRAGRVVNWDPKGQTTVSDDEVVHVATTGTLYTFRYSADFPISIATTRPETKVGDVAVSVHPSDERYQKYIGQEYQLEFAGVPLSIKIVADEAVDPEYGTGAVGITPAHSMTDWEIAERHNLPLKQVINEYAKMENVSPELEGKKITEARELIVAWLKKQDLLEKEEKIDMNISQAERSGGIIEPLPKLQWFINVDKPFVLEHSEIKGIESGSETTLKKIMTKAVARGQINILPDRFAKVYFHWINNLRDWCISRQIWYGHRVPVWYKGDEVYVGTTAPTDDGWTQDPDTLDTWFSSGLWTFSTLGWPEVTSDLGTYHPTTVLETGYDIIFFWVARMILMSGFLLGTIPFKTVYLHGLVRDEKGRKISKSLGNNIDPVELIEKYGADALRMALVVGVGPGSDSNLGEAKIKAYKNFANKVWNASRFVLENVPDDFSVADKPKLSTADETYIAELNELVRDVTDDMEQYRFYLAAEKLYHYFWHTFADVIIETSKPRLMSDNKTEQEQAVWLLHHILTTSLQLLHPFMPFITEEIWPHLPDHEDHLLMVSAWPDSSNPANHPTV